MPRQSAVTVIASPRVALVSAGVLALAGCSPEGAEDASGRIGAQPADPAETATLPDDTRPTVNELPRACDLLSAAADINGPGDAAGSGPFRSVCRWQTTDGRTVSMAVSSLSMDTLDYRAMGEEAFATAITSLVAPSYADVRHIATEDDPGAGAWSFDVEGDAVTWVNTGITHRIAPGPGRNELFLLVRVSGGDDATDRERTLAVASDVQARLLAWARSEDRRP